MSGAKHQKIYFVVPPSTFWLVQVQLVVFGDHFLDGNYSLVSLLFTVLLLTVPPPRAQPFVKVRETCPCDL